MEVLCEAIKAPWSFVDFWREYQHLHSLYSISYNSNTPTTFPINNRTIKMKNVFALLAVALATGAIAAPAPAAEPEADANAEAAAPAPAKSTSTSSSSAAPAATNYGNYVRVSPSTLALPLIKLILIPSLQGNYGTYQSYPAKGNYGTYQKYPAPASYSNYPKSYANYGSYKRDAEAEADADLDALLDMVYSIKEKRGDNTKNKYTQYGK